MTCACRACLRARRTAPTVTTGRPRRRRGADLLALLQSFLALYVYNRVPVVAERLSRLSDPVAMRRADQEMRQIIADLVAIHWPEDPFAVDWRGEQGRGIAEDAISSAYQAISALDDGDES